MANEETKELVAEPEYRIPDLQLLIMENGYTIEEVIRLLLDWDGEVEDSRKLFSKLTWFVGPEKAKTVVEILTEWAVAYYG